MCFIADNAGSVSALQAYDLEDVRESVRQGVTKVAGRISSLANGVMSSLQVRFFSEILFDLQQFTTLFVDGGAAVAMSSCNSNHITSLLYLLVVHIILSVSVIQN